MFSRLSTKLTVVFAGLFVAAMVVTSIATYGVVNSRVRANVGAELEASGAVFLRLWIDKETNLLSNAALLSKDFGFRAALASEDEPTIASALANLRSRLGFDTAAFLDPDGALVAIDGSLSGSALTPHLANIEQSTAGVFYIGERPYHGGATPLLAPNLLGWIVFVDELDRAEYADLESLSAIPLAAGIEPGAAQGPEPFHQGDSLVLTKTLPTFNRAAPAHLRLTFPMSEALAPYRPLVAALGAVVLLGILGLIACSWYLARRLTIPITALSAAAAQLRDGDAVTVTVQTKDEIADLAKAFNEMADGIRAREAQVRHLAFTDRETELPNRQALEEQIQNYGQHRDRAVLIAASVDRFDHIRNAIGYRLASELIAEIGQRIFSHTGVETVARVSTGLLGGVIFADGEADALRIAGEVQSYLGETVEIGGHRIDVQVTFGLAWVMGDTDPVDRAAIALRQAQSVNSRARFFDADAYGDPTENLSLMGDLLTAIERGDLAIVLQPKYDLRERCAVGAEALVRWNHPERGFISPDTFIPLAEETGHIGALTLVVICQALAAQAELAAQGHDLAISINLSGRLLGDKEFEDAAMHLVSEATGPVCFEITETAVIEDPDKGIAAIRRYSEAGLAISIDDYGSGLSSLAYLKQIPADELKIDKAFVLEIDKNHRDALLVKSTVDLAHNLGMKVTAEGIETAVAASLLAGMGCDVGQGYGLGRPMALADLMTHLNADRLNEAEEAEPLRQKA